MLALDGVAFRSGRFESTASEKMKNTKFIAVMYIYLILGGIGKCLLLVLAGVLLLLLPLLLYCFRLGFFNFDPLGRRTLEEEVGGEGSLFAPPMLLVVVVLFVSVVVVVVVVVIF